MPNALMILLNLMPFAGLDGVEAWQLFGRRRSSRRRQHAVHEKWAAKTDNMMRAIEDAKRARDRRDS